MSFPITRPNDCRFARSTSSTPGVPSHRATWLSGALTNPVDGAVFLFKGLTPEAAERFAQEDPYVKNGVVTKWRVREWTTVVGADATTPMRPQP